jgi:magnesium transporter
MLRYLNLVNGKLVESESGAGAVCVYIAPDEAERKFLIEELKIDEHTLNSALDPDEPSRLEFEPEHVATIFKRPSRYGGKENFLFKAVSAGAFMFKDRLVIVEAEDAPVFEGKTFAKVQSIPDLLLRLIYRSISHFASHIRGIDAISSELEQQIYVSMENKYLVDLFTLEKSLVYYLSAINSNGMLIEKLKNNAAKIGFSPENMEFLDDILIENSQCRIQADIYSQVLASLMDARASIVGNNLNIRIKALTLITIAIMLPTLVVSIFSMNVRIPLAWYSDAFWVITGMAGMSATIMGVLWWRRRW